MTKKKDSQIDLYRMAVGEEKALEAEESWRDCCPDCWQKQDHHPLCKQYVPTPVETIQESLPL